MGKTCSLLLVATFVCVLTATAGAQRARNPEAEALFDEGKKLMARGDHASACPKLAASNDLEPRAVTLMSLGACLEAQQRLASASKRFVEAQQLAASSGDAKAEAQAKAKVDALAPRLSTIQIVVSAEAAVPDLSITRNGELINATQWNTPIPIDGGTYSFVAYGRGTDEWTGSVTVANEGDSQQVTIPRLTSAKPPVAEAPPPTSTPASEPETVEMAPLQAPGLQTDTKAPGGLAPWTWYAIAGGCVVAGLAIDLGAGSSSNGKFDALDFVPLALYGAGVGLVYKERF
jgi:hypothetical protein